MKRHIFSAILLISSLTAVSAIRWKDCGSKGSTVKTVAVTGCDNEQTCPLPRGENATFTVSFHTKESFKKAKAVVHGILADLPVPFPVPNPDGCKNSGLTCPVKSGTDNKYDTNIYIKDSYPKVRVVVKWELKDENDNDIFCIEIPAEVSDSNKIRKLN